jgi:hypothetical protein
LLHDPLETDVIAANVFDEEFEGLFFSIKYSDWGEKRSAVFVSLFKAEEKLPELSDEVCVEKDCCCATTLVFIVTNSVIAKMILPLRSKKRHTVFHTDLTASIFPKL